MKPRFLAIATLTFLSVGTVVAGPSRMALLRTIVATMPMRYQYFSGSLTAVTRAHSFD